MPMWFLSWCDEERRPTQLLSLTKKNLHYCHTTQVYYSTTQYYFPSAFWFIVKQARRRKPTSFRHNGKPSPDLFPATPYAPTSSNYPSFAGPRICMYDSNTWLANCQLPTAKKNMTVNYGGYTTARSVFISTSIFSPPMDHLNTPWSPLQIRGLSDRRNLSILLKPSRLLLCSSISL